MSEDSERDAAYHNMAAMRRAVERERRANVTTWGELTPDWFGRTVLVRWEDGGLPIADGLPSGIPHEWRGQLGYSIEEGFWLAHDFGGFTTGFPDHALVQEAPK